MSTRDQEKAILRAKKAALRKVEEKRQKDILESEKAQAWIELLGQCEDSAEYARSEKAAQKARKLCRGGIPPHMRGKVWPILIGKDEVIDQTQFSVLREKADKLRKSSGLGVPRDSVGYVRQPEPQVESVPPSSSSLLGEEQEKIEEKKIGLGLKRDSLDIGMERLVLDVDEVVQVEGARGNIDPMVDTLVNLHTKDSGAQLSEMKGSLVQSTASSIDEVMRSGSIDLRASFDLAKNAFSLDQPTPPRKGKPSNGDSDFVISSEKAVPPALPSLSHEDDASEGECGRGSGSSSGRSLHSSAQGGGGEVHEEEKLYSAELIKYDLPRTLPTLKFFHDGGSLNSDLERVLCAYIVHAPQVGYVQGMSFVVAMLLLYLDDSEALSCFVNLLKRRGIGEFYHLQKEALDAYVNCFDYFFEQSLPLLYHHLKREGLSSDMFLLDWHLTLFVKPLPLDCAARVWDIFLGADETYGLRIALGILRLFAPELSTMDLESLMSFLTRLPENLRADALLQSVEEIKIPYKKFEKVRERELAKVSGQGVGDKREKDGCVLV